MVFSNQLKKEQNLELKKKDFDWSQFTTFTANHFYYFIKYILEEKPEVDNKSLTNYQSPGYLCYKQVNLNEKRGKEVI